MTTLTCTICGDTFEGRADTKVCGKKQCKLKQNAANKNKPHPCECGGPGVKRIGAGWACQRCLDIEARMNAPKPRRSLVFGAMWFESADYYRMTL